jgi:hypothetical protein
VNFATSHSSTDLRISNQRPAAVHRREGEGARADGLKEPHQPRLPRASPFPDPQHPPAGRAQGATHDRSRALLAAPPERGVVRGLGAKRAGVPEAAVHEHRQPQPRKDEVRADAETTEDGSLMPAGKRRKPGSTRRRGSARGLWTSNFGFVSDFGLRTSNFPMPPPSRDRMPAKQRRQSQFSVLVVLSTDAGHHLERFRFVKTSAMPVHGHLGLLHRTGSRQVQGSSWFPPG